MQEPVISARRRPPARPTGVPSPATVDAPVPVVGGREACPCGSGKRFKACHGRVPAQSYVARPFAGLEPETEWVALREIVPSATAPLRVVGHEDRQVTLTTVLPSQWPAMVGDDGSVMLGLQVVSRSSDAGQDLAAALLAALASGPGAVLAAGLPAPGPRLQELLVAEPLRVTLHEGFDQWLVASHPGIDIAATVERANAAILPTAAVPGVTSAYWCRMREREQLRWVWPYDEEPLLDALARMAVAGALAVGPGSRYLGSFRAYGLLVGVWDLPAGSGGAELAEPAADFRTRLDELLADPRALTGAERRARAGLLSRQVTLR